MKLVDAAQWVWCQPKRWFPLLVMLSRTAMSICRPFMTEA
jgi:hypothetical protein